MRKHVQRRDFLKAASVGLFPLVGPPAQAPSAAPSEAETNPPERTAAAPRVRLAQPQILINQRGPLPITGDFTLSESGPVTLFISGSVWTTATNAIIGIEVNFDGVTVGTAQIYSNTPNAHHSVIPIYIPITLDKPWLFDQGTPRPPTYSATLKPMNADTVSDFNDYFHLALLA